MTSEGAAPLAPALPPPAPLSRNRDFRLLWTGQAVSLLGTTVTQIAYPLLVLALTGSAAYAGLVGAAELAAFVLLGLPGGLLADRANRRTIMITADAVRAVVLALLAVAVLTGRASVWLVVVSALVSSAFDALYLPASQGALKQVVPASQLSTVYAFREGRGAVAQLAGPPLGGWLFAVGRSVPFLFDAVSYGVCAVALLFIRRPLQADRRTDRPADHSEPPWTAATRGSPSCGTALSCARCSAGRSWSTSRSPASPSSSSPRPPTTACATATPAS